MAAFTTTSPASDYLVPALIAVAVIATVGVAGFYWADGKGASNHSGTAPRSHAVLVKTVKATASS